MKRFLYFLFLLFPFWAWSQSATADRTMQVRATVSDNPPSITLHWVPDASANTIQISRKTKSATSWGIVYASLTASDSTFTDTALAVGEEWEYQVYKSTSAYTGTGYILAGIQVEETEHRGVALLVVDTTHKQALQAEILRFEEDLRGDGWEVRRLEVAPTDAPPAVRTRIQTEYNLNSQQNHAVILLGHVPVPYSGIIYPDGHTNHRGAWPADVYYGDLDGNWTDFSINNTTASRPANHNVPGDGKFDQSSLPSEVDVWVGRIDFANMSTFAESEADLLKRYLNKVHKWRHKLVTAQDKAVVDDNFGTFNGEIFAGNGWRNFGPLVGPQNVSAGDFRTNLAAQSHLWAYGCGGGSYTSASGIGNTGNFASDSLLGVFTMIFGSYHGDFDAPNNFMRAALASKGSILSCAWAGRPHWQFHHMGLGNPIGYSAQISQNNVSTYFASFFPRYVHMALMGDPTVRMHVVGPPANLTVQSLIGDRYNELSWTASTDSVLGYYLYAADSSSGPFVRKSGLITSTTWIDSCPDVGDNHYMLRAVKLQEGFSGSYYNLSQGIFASATNLGYIGVPAVGYYNNMTFVCPGDSVDLAWQVFGPQCPQATFYVELSDSLGSFAAPDTLLMTQDTSSVVLSKLYFNQTFPAGSGYRIRIQSSDPAHTSPPNAVPITIHEPTQAAFTYSLSGVNLTLNNQSTNALLYAWSFGDGDTSPDENPTHIYTQTGSYNLILIAIGNCNNDTVVENITLLNRDGLSTQINMELFPNPATERVQLRGNWPEKTAVLRLYSINGKLLKTWQVEVRQGEIQKEMDLSGLPSGMFLLEIEGEQRRINLKLLKE